MMLASGPDPDMVDKAKELCDDLIGNVKEQYEEFKSRPPRFSDRGGHHGGGDRYRGGHDRHYDRGNPRQSHSSYGGYGSDQRAAPASNSPVPSADSTAQNPADYQAAYAQYYGGTDPYAAYGGYAKYVTLLPNDLPFGQQFILTSPQLRRHVPALLRAGSGDRCSWPTWSSDICITSAASSERSSSATSTTTFQRGAATSTTLSITSWW